MFRQAGERPRCRSCTFKEPAENAAVLRKGLARMSPRRHGQVNPTCSPSIQADAPWAETAGTLSKSGSPACRSRGMRTFPAARCATFQPEAFDDPREIVGAPTVTQDQCDRDGFRVSAHLEIARVLAE
jgi:hypothetical protein